MATVVAGVTMVTGGGGPELSTVGATVEEDERVETVLQDVVKGQLETMDTEVVDFVVALAAVTVREPLVTLQCVSGTAPPTV